MALEATDYIPNVDGPVSDSIRSLLEAQIQAERPADYTTRLHANVSTDYTPNYPASITFEHVHLATDKPKQTGIDLSRYEADALDPPNRTFPTSDEAKPEYLKQWRETLRKAYASSTYLTGRNTNLALLETYGKNAWLISNWHAEAELKALEVELAEVKRQAEELEGQRTRKQEATAAEMAVLEGSWKKALGGLVEVQVATQGLRQQVLDKRRQAVDS